MRHCNFFFISQDIMVHFSFSYPHRGANAIIGHGGQFLKAKSVLMETTVPNESPPNLVGRLPKTVREVVSRGYLYRYFSSIIYREKKEGKENKERSKKMKKRKKKKEIKMGNEGRGKEIEVSGKKEGRNEVVKKGRKKEKGREEKEKGAKEKKEGERQKGIKE